MDPSWFRVELWAPASDGAYLPAFLCTGADIRSDIEVVDMTVDYPRKRNPARTRWGVIIAALTLRRPPPRYVLDETRAGFREFASGLRSVSMSSPCEVIGDDGFLCAQHAASTGRPLRLMIDGRHSADAYLTELGSHGRRFYVNATIIPKQEGK